MCFLRLLAGWQVSIGLLFSLMIVVFLGTAYEVTEGIQAAQGTFFDSWFFELGGVLPVPGVRFVLILLGINQFFSLLYSLPEKSQSVGAIYIRAGFLIVLIVSGLSNRYSQQFFLTLSRGKQISLPAGSGLPQNIAFENIERSRYTAGAADRDGKAVIVKIKDHNGSRSRRIALNKPMRYDAFSFYHNGIRENGADVITNLLVVYSPFRLTMLVGGIMVLLGLCIQFIIPLLKTRVSLKTKRINEKGVTHFERRTTHFTPLVKNTFTILLHLAIIYAFFKSPFRLREQRYDWFGIVVILYGVSSVLYMWAYVRFKYPMLLTAAGLLVSTGFAIHTCEMIRMVVVIERIPLGTLYETLLITAWMGIVCGFLISRFSDIPEASSSITTLMATFLLFLAGMYKPDVPVKQISNLLDAPFWLATHVSTIILGYAGLLCASLAGHLYVFMRLRKKTEMNKAEHVFGLMQGFMRGGFMCAVLGVMLGALWAEHSCGRYWGWDPKENGALLIILWGTVAVIVSGYKQIDKKYCALCNAGQTVLIMLTWIGVNLAGKGLHSYGLTGKGKLFLTTVIILESGFYIFSLIWFRIQEKAIQTNKNGCVSISLQPTTAINAEKQNSTDCKKIPG
ncbi:MAG: cytochrome c biogenesis protein [Chitinispirillaceae bacterium]